MGTKIRSEISKKNRWWISKHRYLELYHFCLQYNEWKKAYAELSTSGVSSTSFINLHKDFGPSDPVGNVAVKRVLLENNMRMVEEAAIGADEFLAPFILRAVTEELSFSTLKSVYGIPCERDMYYDRYRKFFWVLNSARNLQRLL